MARPSKLSPEQWADVERRAAAGETTRALAREFGIDEAAIRRRVNPQTPRIKEVAAKVVEAREALATLPPAQQYIALNLADKLRNISNSLASAAELGAATAHRLNALANTEVAKVDDANPLTSIENLKGVGVLTKLANESAHVALNLISANKNIAGANQEDAPKLDETSRAARVAQLFALAQARANDASASRGT